ncbi:MAG: Hsp33 chaperonin [Burkholderiales bacterium 35-55-47]|jgi:molecular chaperone Hsp33|uniref:Hsp33 family molecular chaperone HslO n=1 Tax=Limnohabitans sp. TaxID=1907725 RepID=UPI000BCC6C14|nr:Hsp33 family molecular chaperone HslO [Limnohabitans sp.]OYY19721.1 MAG: Hsp33 chaperonin [Burkholderiales bacterium 35-55-47]OYZ74669.1 MAG: Hsp33 chaperonin [Burkholderiales bacterium 24-55-52]OZB01442.1 MAG: Hsp33 chaperonin [Burkholderiales bacterium 39-55-53]HQR85916.1 Hsp33 family molecular chaperone HslO [Limnohabitans sp.]HQS26168.1 Hsp33 family molecular chaperone HslO [Limnohabitans sp.]
MSQLHKFLFDGLPVRGMLVQLTDVWQEVLKRRAANAETGPYAEPVRHLLGEMTAAAVLMQSNIKFNGALVMQIFGDGPLKLAVVEVQPDLSLRATAKVVGDLGNASTLPEMVNVNNEGKCAITLDPLNKMPGQQPYQGVVPLFDDHRNKLDKFSDVLQHYMLQSEQLDTTLVLAANDTTAAGLLIQRLPIKGEANLAAQASMGDEDGIGLSEDYNRISILASSLTADELLNLDAETILRRLFWEEKLVRFEPITPSFACSCSRERVSNMIRSLGTEEVESILAERGDVEVGCDFCGQQYRYDAVDAAQIFTGTPTPPPAPSSLQ